MIKIRAEARCPNSYYEGLIMDISKFDKMTKMNLVAFINMNSDEDEQVTMRPRKSTLVRIAKKIAVSQSTKAGCSGWYEKHDSDIAVLNKMAEEACDPKKGDGLVNSLAAKAVLMMTFGFLIIIGLGVAAKVFNIEILELVATLVLFLMLFGIPIRVFMWEKKGSING